MKIQRGTITDSSGWIGLDVPEEFFGHIKLMMGKLLRIKNNHKWSLTARTTEHAVEAHFDSFFIH